MPVEQREMELERDYHLQMTEELRKDVDGMCNYSDAILMQGIEKGISQGIAQGIAQGKDIGAYETIVDLVRKKLLSIKNAAEQLGMTEKDFCEKAGIQKNR